MANKLPDQRSNTVLRTSRFLHEFRRNGRVCLFHSLSMKTLFGDTILSDIKNFFTAPHSVQEWLQVSGARYNKKTLSVIIRDMVKSGMLTPDKEADVAMYLDLFNIGIKQNRIRHIYFIPTTACNFRCTYCFIKDARPMCNPVYMRPAMVDMAVEVFLKVSSECKDRSMTLYGGEPLLNAQGSFRALEAVRRMEKGTSCEPVRLSLVTNGSLVNNETIEILKRTNTSVSVSLDGPRAVHNSNRIDSSGKSTFDKAVTAYWRLKKKGIDVGISCTLAPNNIENVAAIVDFIIQELKPKSMGFNILLPQMTPLDGAADYGEEYYCRAAQKVVEAFKILRQYSIYEDRVMRRVIPYLNRSFHLKDCMGVGGQIVVTPDGRIGPCQALLGYPEYFPLTVEKLHKSLNGLTSDTIYRDPLFYEWNQRFPLNMERCIDCVAVSICGGGCPYASLAKSGSIWEIDKRVCYQSKQVLEWMIWDTCDHMPKSLSPGRA